MKIQTYKTIQLAILFQLTQPRGRHDLSAQQRGLLVGEKMSTHQKRQEVTLAAKPMPILDFEGNLVRQFKSAVTKLWVISCAYGVQTWTV